MLAAWVGHEFAVMATVFAQRCAANGLMNPQRLLLFQNFLVRGLAVASAGLFMVPEPAFAQDLAINFNNSVFGTSRLVTDAAGEQAVRTDLAAQLPLDTSVGLSTVTGAGSCLFSATGKGAAAVWYGRNRSLEFVSFSETAQAEVTSNPDSNAQSKFKRGLVI